MKTPIDLKQKILDGAVFIYPTDTIYGLGCNALDACAVDRIKEIKGRDKNKPMSVIAPSMDWIEENCIVPRVASSQFSIENNNDPPTLPKLINRKLLQGSASKNNFLKKYLPGPYTLILKKKNPDFLKHVASGDTLGVRIPDCEFTSRVQEAGVPIITTSVNLSGQKPANCIDDIHEEIINKVDFAFDYGGLSGRPSTLVVGEKEIER